MRTQFFVNFIECLNSINGTNCETRCPDNMYGKLCSQRCECKRNQQCDRILGCIGISFLLFDFRIIHFKTYIFIYKMIK